GFDRQRVLAGGGHRDHEHHAGERDRAHAGDRHPHGGGGDRSRCAAAIPDRGAGAGGGGRGDRDILRADHLLADLGVRQLAGGRVARIDRGGGAVLGGDRNFLRVLSGEEG